MQFHLLKLIKHELSTVNMPLKTIHTVQRTNDL